MQFFGPTSGRRTGPARGSLPLFLCVLLAVTVGACFSSRDGQGPGSSPYADRPVRVSVENHNWNTIHVYVLAGGQFDSLGQITSQGSDEFEIPASLMGSRKEIRLAADPIGSSEGFISDPILVEPGDVVSWTITQPLVHSRVFVN